MDAVGGYIGLVLKYKSQFQTTDKQDNSWSRDGPSMGNCRLFVFREYATINLRGEVVNSPHLKEIKGYSKRVFWIFLIYLEV